MNSFRLDVDQPLPAADLDGGGIGKGSAGIVRNLEVAGRVAEWLGIEKPRPQP
jgi:hypothetical protein